MTATSLPVTDRRPPHFWGTFLVNLLLPGVGLPWIGLHRLYLILQLASYLLVGPVARRLYGTAPDWGFYVWLSLLAFMVLGFPRLYDHQFPKGQPVRALPPLPLRLMGVWLPALGLALIQLGYVLGLFSLTTR